MKRYGITLEQWQTANDNGINRSTVYKRIRQGWTIKDAVSTPTDLHKNSQRVRSRFYGRERGKTWVIRLPAEYDAPLKEKIAKSGLTEQDFLAELLVDWLDREQNPKGN